MFEVKTENQGRLLRIKYAGNVTETDAKLCARQITQLLATAPPGFRVLVDLTALERMDPNCMPHLARIMELCNERGVGQVVRVIPDPHKDPGLNILSFFHYDEQVAVTTCESLDEAEQHLARPQ